MLKVAVTVTIVILLIIFGRLGYESVQTPSLVVSLNYPPPGTIGGRYTYLLDFTPSAGTRFSNMSVTRVDIMNSMLASISSTESSESQWTIALASASRVVVAHGPPVPSIAVRFDDMAPDESYTVGEMHVNITFTYSGWFSTWVGNTTVATVLVPVPRPVGMVEAPAMDPVRYQPAPVDLNAAVPRWY